MTAALLAIIAVAVVSPALAHDTWVITHDQESIAHAKPAPEIFTTLGVANVAISLLALLGVVGWIVIGRTTIPDRIAQRLGLPEIDTARLEPWVPTALRLGLATMFVTAAFALHPRLVYEIGDSPVLFASEVNCQQAAVMLLAQLLDTDPQRRQLIAEGVNGAVQGALAPDDNPARITRVAG